MARARHYIVIGEQGFRELVAGRATSVSTGDGQEVKVILSDIGWDRMLSAINDAIRVQEEGSRADPR